MDRLVDYFAVVGYDHDAEDKPGAVRGKVLTRIPEQNWDDAPFIDGIHLFCQPTGWFLSKEKHPPKYYVAVLTDAEGRRHYCAVLTFSEPVREENSSPDLRHEHVSRRESSKRIRIGNIEEIEESLCEVDAGQELKAGKEIGTSDRGEAKEEDHYMPKCLVLISRHQEFTVFKNCLGLIYTIYIEGLSVSLETVIANLLVINMPPRGAPVMRFSIGAADRQALQTPECEELPVTRSSVSMLLRHLGILNVMNVLTAALVDQKLLFYSCSYSRLSDSCNALTALMFPFSYSYPYIPILPQTLLECTSSPTPFLIGVHSSLRPELHDLVDVIAVDLDGGVISVPECISIPHIPEPYYTQAVELLTKVLCPDLVVADYAYPPEVINTSDPERLDKEIRAIFLRLFCQLLMGYRSCLQVCRIHPKPIIRFQKELFLILRGYDKIQSSSSADFMPKLIESQAFSLFIQEQGPPYRRLNMFDREVAAISERMKREGGVIHKALLHVKELSSELYRNENPSSSPPVQKLPKPSEAAYLRPHQIKFPKLSPTAVQTFMADRVNKNKPRNVHSNKQPSMLVPDGQPVDLSPRLNMLTSSSRRLDVLRSCVQFIFENRNLETKKIFHAVLRTLKNRMVRSALTHELNNYAKLKPCLDNQQFEYIARLCNSALDVCCGEDDEFRITADLLPALSTFYRKLCPTVLQFLYSVVQDHTVWARIEFWDFMFFRDVQGEICRLYQMDQRQNNKGNFNQKTVEDLSITADLLKRMKDSESLNGRCLEIAAEELRDVLFKSEKEKKDLSCGEEGVIMGKIQHTAQIMIFMLVPLSDTEGITNVRFLSNPESFNEDSSNSYFTSSLAGSIKGESIDCDEENASYQGGLDVKGVVAKFVSMFVDRVCSETAISAEYSKALVAKVSGLVLMQHESLQDIAQETRSLPPIKKVKLLQPKMLPGELLFIKHTLRVYLASDGRLASIGGPALLPAEGAIFVSNYRVMFIGIPCDTLASEQVIIRSFPLSALFKVKTFSDHDRVKNQKIDASVQHWGVLYSTSFQLLLIAFDEDIGEEDRTAFEQKLNALRNPSTIDETFAISQQISPVARIHSIASDKNFKSSKSGNFEYGKSNSKHSAKQLVKQAKKKAGLTLGKQQRFTTLMLTDGKSSSIYRSSVASDRAALEHTAKSHPVDEIFKRLLADKGTLEQLHNLACLHDYQRLKLLEGSYFRMTTINRTFVICRSYPIFAIVPKHSSDDRMKSLALCHQQNRFPSIVWMHPKSKALLLRASAFKSRVAAAISKHGSSSQSLSDEGTAGSSVEVEKFLVEIIQSSYDASKKSANVISVIKTKNGSAQPNNDRNNKSPHQKTNNGFANSFRDGRPESILGLRSSRKWGTLTRVMSRPASEFLNSKSAARMHAIKSNDTLRSNLGTLTPNTQGGTQLYVLVDKVNIKAVKSELQGRIKFLTIGIPEPREVRNSFKSVLKVCLPVDPPPSAQPEQASIEDSQLFRKAFETTKWSQMVTTLLASASAIAEMLDVQSASVMLALETGWDATPQLTSLVQLILDPHYRTLEGFQCLLQKEWFSFGHRFSHRNCFNDVLSSGFTPIFLQFLDCVYQILHQFPLAFEFNHIFLETLAYHCTSNRFKTFILDSDYERFEAGILLEQKKTPTSHNWQKNPSNVKSSKAESLEPISSVWEYINLIQKRSQVFLNTLHHPNLISQHVLHPVTGLCRFFIWPFFTHEAVADFPAYDGLLGEFLSTNSSPNEQETPEAGEGWGIQSGRRVVNPSYDNVFEVQPDAFCSLIHQIENLYAELGKVPLSGREIWMSAMKSAVSTKPKKLPLNVHQARNEAKLMNERLLSALEIRSVTPENLSETMLFPNVAETVRQGNSEKSHSSLLYQLQTTSSEVRTYEGTLWKRGAYMKHWRQRYFVLDSTKHQLRQYESKLDQTFKSSFDMKEVESVQMVGCVSGAPKGVEDNAFFELKTSKRFYHFIAESNDDAKKWIEALQNALEA